MKKILYILGAVLILASCSKREADKPTTNSTFTFSTILGEAEEIAKSRTNDVVRYILEIYQEDLNGTLVRQENTTGIFDVTLEKDLDYICLFWADGGAADYNTESLKAISQTTETAIGKIAYYAAKTVNSKNFDGNVTLTHAVAEMVFVETGGFVTINNTLAVTYPFASTSFNVADGTVSHSTGSTMRTFSNIGAVAAQGTVATDYILAPKEQAFISDLKFEFNTEGETTITRTPVQGNSRTILEGAFVASGTNN